MYGGDSVSERAKEWPAQEVEHEHHEQPTLRDQFAMAALSGMLQYGDEAGTVAMWSYKYADSMMLAREKGGE